MSEILYKTKYLNFKSTLSPSGHDWCYVSRTNDSSLHDSAVVITTVVFENNIPYFLLMKTKRPPLYAENKSIYCLESPAGLIGDETADETLIECAKKELMEEAGLIPYLIYEEISNSSSSSGLTSETLSYVTAFVKDYLPSKNLQSDGGIIIERFMIKADEITSYLLSLDKKEISIASATVCGIFFALERLKQI